MSQQRNYSVLLLQPWLDYRGAESVSLLLCSALAERGVESKILCLFVSDAVAHTFDTDRILLPPERLQKLMQIKPLFLLFGFWVLLFYLFYYGRRFTFYNPHNFPTVWCAIIVGWFYSKKVLWTVHNFPQHPFRGLVGSTYDLLIKPLDTFLIRHVDLCISVSKKVADEVQERYRVTSKVIYPCIDVTFWEQTKGQALPEDVNSFTRSRPYLLHVGQVRSEKKQDLTVRIFEKLSTVIPDLVLVFAGERRSLDYPEMGYLAPEMRSKIMFTGRVPKDRLRELYAGAAALIFPSSWGEGCALTPLEGVAAGISTLVVAQGSGADELLGMDNSQCVIPMNDTVDRIVDRIKERISSGALRNRERLLQIIDPAVVSQEYDEIFSSYPESGS